MTDRTPKGWTRGAGHMWTAALLLAVCSIEPLFADDSSPSWPQFLGPTRNGVSDETGLFETWPTGGPKEVWRVDGGAGMSGLAIHDGRLVTMVQRGGKQIVVAHDARTGKALWQKEVGPAYKNQMGNGPRATPTIADGSIYIFTGEGILAALQLADGEIIWQVDAVKKLGGQVAGYGMACSPLVVNDTVVVTVGAPGAAVAGFDRKSGTPRWQAGDEAAGYSSPALLRVGGQPQIVAYCGTALMSLNPKSGKQLWRYPYVTDFECNIATPLAYEGQVFISSGENHGCALLAASSTGASWNVEEVWTSQRSQSVMRNEWQTSVLLDGHLYGFDNVGSAGPVTHLNCVNIKTGKRVWQERRFGKGNLIAADGKLLIVNTKGEFVAVRATPDKFEELGRKAVTDFTRQAPALAGGLLYLRDEKEIVCLDVRQP